MSPVIAFLAVVSGSEITMFIEPCLRGRAPRVDLKESDRAVAEGQPQRFQSVVTIILVIEWLTQHSTSVDRVKVLPRDVIPEGSAEKASERPEGLPHHVRR